MSQYSYEDLVEFSVWYLQKRIELKVTSVVLSDLEALAKEQVHQSKKKYFEQAFKVFGKHRWAFDLLAEESARAVEAGDFSDARLTEWAARCLRGEFKRPPGKRGRKRSDHKFDIALAVREISRLTDYSATRNDETETASACDIVAEAATRLGLSPANYKSVKDCFFEHKPLLDWKGEPGSIEADFRGRTFKMKFVPMSDD